MKALQYIPSLLKGEKSWIVADQLVSSGGSFITTIMLARGLGIDSFGVYSSIVLFLFLLLSISNALIISPFQVLQAHEPRLKSYISSLFYWQLILCAVFMASAAAVSFMHIPALAPVGRYIAVVLCLIAGFILQDFCRRILLAVNKPREAFYSDAVSNTLQLAWLGFSLITGTLTLHYALLIIALTYIPSILLALYFIRPVWPSASRLTTVFNSHCHTGKWLLLSAVLQWWAGNLFVVASGLFLGVRALGAFRLAQTLFGVLNVFLQVYENHVLPNASRLYAQSADLLKAYLWNTTRKSFLLLLPVSLCLIIFARPIFLLSGGYGYVEYAYVLQGMTVLYLLIFTGYPIRTAIRVMQLNRDFFTGYIISFAFSALAAGVFIRHWGITGVISGLIINQLCMQAYWQWVLMRKQFILWN